MITEDDKRKQAPDGGSSLAEKLRGFADAFSEKLLVLSCDILSDKLFAIFHSFDAAV